MRRAQAAAAGRELTREAAKRHLEGIRRLDQAARWVRAQDLGFEDPAFFFYALAEPDA